METQQEAFKEETPKEENNEEWERDQPPMLLVQHWFWYPDEQMEGISDTPRTLGWHYKKGSSQQLKAFSNSKLE